MKEVTGIARNISYLKSKDGTYAPLVEVVFVVSEPVFRVDAAGQMVRERVTEGLRFATSPAGLRNLAESFKRYADEAEGKGDGGDDDED